MTNPMVREYDKDNNLVDRPMNDAEFIQYQKDQALWNTPEPLATPAEKIVDGLDMTVADLKKLLGLPA